MSLLCSKSSCKGGRRWTARAVLRSSINILTLTLVFAGRWFCCVSLRSPLGLETWGENDNTQFLLSHGCAAGHCARVVRLVIVEKCAHSSVSYTTTHNQNGASSGTHVAGCRARTCGNSCARPLLGSNFHSSLPGSAGAAGAAGALPAALLAAALPAGGGAAAGAAGAALVAADTPGGRSSAPSAGCSSAPSAAAAPSAASCTACARACYAREPHGACVARVRGARAWRACVGVAHGRGRGVRAWRAGVGRGRDARLRRGRAARWRGARAQCACFASSVARRFSSFFSSASSLRKRFESPKASAAANSPP
eukprot:scaffold35682_cov60-Phaeocystis_antarctica.AAC.4